jgi:hypothetical protein
MENSTSPPGADDYAALVKPGDAVETPDGELWVVEAVTADALDLASAYRDASGLVIADAIELTRTTVPTTLTHKVADARQVRRP